MTLDIGSFRTRTRGGVSRRSFLKIGAGLPIVLGAASGAVFANPPPVAGMAIMKST